MTVRGLQFAGHTYGIHCASDGTTEVLNPPADLKIEVC
jgi:hypothetical protein